MKYLSAEEAAKITFKHPDSKMESIIKDMDARIQAAANVGRASAIIDVPICCTTEFNAHYGALGYEIHVYSAPYADMVRSQVNWSAQLLKLKKAQ